MKTETGPCEDCAERTRRNQAGDAFNPTANPMDSRLEELYECTSSFDPIKSYFHVEVTRCRRCKALWLLGYFEDFDVVPITAEWGLRTWVWRPLARGDLAQIRSARSKQSLDLRTFAAPSVQA